MNGVPSARKTTTRRSRPSTARRHRGRSRGFHVFRSLLSTAAIVVLACSAALVVVVSAAAPDEPEFIASSSSGSAPSAATADADDAATRDTTPAEVDDVNVNVIEGEEEEELEEGGTSDVGWSPPPEHLIDVASGTTDGEVYAGIGASLSLDALRALEDYPRERREEILDLLFKPGYGAAVQVVKVEIGLGNETAYADGDDGEEEEELSFLLSEALERNPDLSVYAALPPLEEEEPNASELVNLVVARLERAKSKGDIVFDYLGLPPPRNDHDASVFTPFFAKTLREFLDTYGFTGTKLVARTAPGVHGGDVEGLCEALSKESEYAAAMYAVSTSQLPTGRGDPEEESKIFQGCKNSNTKIWYVSADEDGQGGYGDRNGAARWLLTTLSTMVESNAVASVSLDALFASVHGASSQSYGSSILTANQPSTGWHNALDADGDGAPLLWAVAHISQFTGPRWRMLPYGWGTGIFSRTGGLGYYVGFVSPDEKDFTLVAVKLRGDRTCDGSKSGGGGGDSVIGGGGGGDNKNEAIQFKFRYGLKYLPDESSKPLQMYYSNFEAEEMSPGGKNARRRPPRLFGHRGQAHMDESGSFLLGFGPGDVYTVSTVRNANKARIRSAYSPASDPRFELPYGDDFEGYEEGRRTARYFSDQVGVWEVRPEYKANKGNDGEEVCEETEEGTCSDPSIQKNNILRPKATGHTIIGMSELNDIAVSAKYRIAPSSSSPMDFAAYAAAASSVSACVGVRADRLWKNGLALCVAGGARGVVWTLSYGGPPPEGRHTKLDRVVATGRLPSGGGGGWHELSLSVRGTEVNATLDGTDLFENRKKVGVRDAGSGFAVLGTNFGPQGYGGERAVIVEFDDFQMDLAPGAATADSFADVSASSKWEGRSLGAAPCSRNGIPDPRQSFDLLADGRIRLVTDEAAAADGSVVVDLCAHLQGKYGPPASGRSAGLSLAPCRRGAFEQHFRTHGGDWCRVRDVAVPLSLGGFHGTEAQHRTLLHKRTLALTGYGNGTVAIANEREGDGTAEEEEAKEEGGELKWKEWAYFPNTKQLRNQAFGAETGAGYPMCLTVMVP